MSTIVVACLYAIMFILVPAAWGFWCARKLRPRFGDSVAFSASMCGVFVWATLATAFRWFCVSW